MFILGDRWRNGYLDYHRSGAELRIRVAAWWPLERLQNVFIEQPRDWRRIINYTREVGVIATLRKIRSRLAERLRDQRVIAVGLGEVIESDGPGCPPGTKVVFVAPRHPPCVERVVLPPGCVRTIDRSLFEKCQAPSRVLCFDRLPCTGVPDYSEVAGWHSFSGAPLSGQVQGLLKWAVDAFAQLDPRDARELPLESTPVLEQCGSGEPTGGRKTAVLFGLGNYAKVCLRPNIDPAIQIVCVHEMDPAQLGRPGEGTMACDTSPDIRSGRHYDVYFIAGYHHTHADLAVSALRSGAWAVVEKPIITTAAQLEALTSALREQPGRLFCCFHMRYNPLYRLAREDLRLTPGKPVNYKCIVYEIGLPCRHWYNWPNSGSRIVSNACHWLDHFLFMNDFARPVRQHVWRGRNEDTHLSVELENGAVLSMALTDIGSRRIGVQEYIELRSGNVTVSVKNAGRYLAEDDTRILRRKNINKLSSYARMYQVISRKIVNGEPGDPLMAVQRSCQLMLDMEGMVQAEMKKLGQGCALTLPNTRPLGAI